MAVMKPNDAFYDMITSAISAPPEPSPLSISADGTINGPIATASTGPFKHGVDYFMSYAQPNLLTIQEAISMDLIAEMGEDAIKKHVKHNMTAKLAEEIASKVTFTAQENYSENTKIVRAKTYVFTHDQLVNFVKNIVR